MPTSHLSITGEVSQPQTLTATDMVGMPHAVDDVAREAPGATGRAVRVADLIAAATPTAAATHCTVISSGGGYRASIPLPELVEGGWLAFASGDGPLPEDAGGPFRLTVAQGTTLCWNVKRVAVLELTAGPVDDDVPENPPH